MDTFECKIESKINQLTMNDWSHLKVCGLIIYWLAINTLTLNVGAEAEQCRSEGYVYGENEIVDQLMVCSLSKSYDLDLTPQGEYIKNTPKSLVEQGFSNKTSILYAKLSGLWTSRRADFVETGWKCQKGQTSITSVIEISGLSLEIVERVDVPIHRNQHKIAVHKPCKTFDLPLWMCRQSKPIYRTTKTWVNRAYFNLTLTQKSGSSKPTIEKLSLLFTCPETFRQKITHSPSASYILAKHMLTSNEATAHNGDLSHHKKRQTTPEEPVQLSHPVSHHSTQDGRGPATPPYHNSVNLIINQVSEGLHSSLRDCIHINDVDLSQLIDHQSFGRKEYSVFGEGNESNELASNQCSDKSWLKNRIEIAKQAAALGLQEDKAVADGSHAKRSQTMLKYPTDPNQLLNPYSFYHDGSIDELADDSG